jgi:hypothetical protein
VGKRFIDNSSDTMASSNVFKISNGGVAKALMEKGPLARQLLWTKMHCG